MKFYSIFLMIVRKERIQQVVLFIFQYLCRKRDWVNVKYGLTSLVRFSSQIFVFHLTFTYLVGSYNLLQVLAPAKLRCHTSQAITAWCQFRIPSVDTTLVTWYAQRLHGPPFLRLPPTGSDSKTLRTGLELSVRAT